MEKRKDNPAVTWFWVVGILSWIMLLFIYGCSPAVVKDHTHEVPGIDVPGQFGASFSPSLVPPTLYRFTVGTGDQAAIIRLFGVKMPAGGAVDLFRVHEIQSPYRRGLLLQWVVNDTTYGELGYRWRSVWECTGVWVCGSQ